MDMSLISPNALWMHPESSFAFPFICKFEHPWDILFHIGDIINEIAKGLDKDKYGQLDGTVWISRNASIAHSSTIKGPCIICEGAEIRPGAFIRGGVIIGRNAVVGNSTELKNCILFDCVQVPHYNYVGDSILGYKSHLGAGAVTSNVKSDKSLVTINAFGERIETGRKKLGAIIGDFVEIGCNTVLNPGTVIGANSIVYPLSSVRGYIPKNSIYKSEGELVKKV
jgi:NDP-sugar pyrophosphorylase family protein